MDESEKAAAVVQILQQHGDAIQRLIERHNRLVAAVEALSRSVLSLTVAATQKPGAGPEAN